MPDEYPSDSDLAALGLREPERARRLLRGLAGQGVTDDLVEQLLPALFDALRESPDPDRALTNFVRWTESVTSRYTHVQYLIGHPAALRIFFSVCGVSQLFSDILIRSPEYFEILANPGVRGEGEAQARSEARYYRELSGFVDGIARIELKLEAMRRFKQRETLRIGTRDILGLADMPTTAREFSNLADACVQKCVEIGAADLRERHGWEPPAAFLVVAMGKLGGQELNYASDIDLMFVCGEASEGDKETGRQGDKETEDTSGNPQSAIRHPQSATPLDYSHRLAEFVVNALARQMQNGRLFRVDVRLRPEGRFGALVRTLASYRAYYESWAEPWERQALIKARPVAGDSRLADEFMGMVTAYVYRRAVTGEFVAAIRENKERIEKKAELEGVTRTNVKIGFGGIRDVEFAAQLLQLELGGRDARLRTPNTLEALARLRQAGAIPHAAADELSEDYQFLRTVEHRLQILYERQTQQLPTDPGERALLARRLSYPDAAAFDADYSRRTERVHAHFERLFYGLLRNGRAAEAGGVDPWRDLLENVEAEPAHAGIAQALAAEGFRDPERAYAFLRIQAFGGEYGRAEPEARERFLALAGRLVAACAHTGDPDAALFGVETLAAASPNPAALFQTLAESEELLDRLCRLAAGSLLLVQSLARHMEWLDLLVSEEILDPALKTAEQARAELSARLPRRRVGRDDEGRWWDALALYIQRERLRIGARDLWGEIDAAAVTEELTALADAVIGAVLERALARAGRAAELDSLAVIGLGKLGGRELGYGSDWDVILVYDGIADCGLRIADCPADAQHATINHQPSTINAAAEYLLAAGQELRPRGAPVEIDARLRPEGRVGALAHAVEAFRGYYETTALTWERQSLTKARPVAGFPETARAFMRLATAVAYERPFTEETAEEIRRMKRRIENERLAAENRWTDVKLGHGGMSDIEFTAQLLQMRYGGEYSQVRVSGTEEALHALARVGALPVPVAARLADTYALWTAVRNHLALLGDGSADVLPDDSARLRALAVGLGWADAASGSAEEQFRRAFDARIRETRATVEKLFYDL